MAAHHNGQSQDWKAMLHRVLLAAVGAVALAQDEVEAFVERLVSRGEIAEKDGKVLVKEVLQKRKEQIQKGLQKGAKTFETGLDDRIERFFNKLHLASKRDVATLTDRIEELNSKLESVVGKKRGR